MTAFELAVFGPLGPWLAVALGLVVGSFLNVCILRWPDEEASVVAPPSRCPVCLGGITWYDNIPVFSWLWLRGRCRRCANPISIRYPATELLTGALFAGAHHLVCWQFPEPSGAAWATLLAGWTLVAVTLIVTYVDIEHFIIPDQVSLNLMAVPPLVAVIWPEIIPQSMFGSLIEALRDGDAAWWSWTPRHVDWTAAVSTSVLGLLLGAGGLWLLGALGSRLLRKDAMGFGDVKLLGMLGAFLGPEGVLVTLVTAAALGSVVGGGLFVFTGNRKIPFGPWLMIGGLATAFAKWTVLRALFGLSA